MITRHHVTLTILCSIIPAGILFSFNPIMAVLMIMGTVIGSIIPDIHMHRSKTSVIRRIPWAIAQMGRVLCIPPMQVIYCKVFGINADPRDKRLTHSIPGLFLYSLIIAVVSGALETLFSPGIPPATAMGFSCGIIMGLALHLAEDMCTKKGIFPAFPFSAWCVAGSIRPCNTDDHRISEFHILYATMAVGYLILIFPLGEPTIDTLIGGAAIIALCVGLMMYRSEVHVRADTPLQVYNMDTVTAYP